MHKHILLFAMLILGTGCTAQVVDTTTAYNGTYNSPTNRFKNNNYLRVYFLNDTTFAFTLIEGYTASDGAINAGTNGLRLNGSSEFGIARLVTYNGVKTWIGIRDLSEMYTDPSNPNFLNEKSRVDFPVVLQKLKDSKTYNDNHFAFNIYLFTLQKNQVKLNGITGVTRFFEEGDYHKVDGSKMLLDINPNDTYFKNSLAEENIAVVKKTVGLLPIPVSDKITANKLLGLVSAGEKVYMLNRSYMQYVFVVQFTNDKKVSRYGWLPKSMLDKAK